MRSADQVLEDLRAVGARIADAEAVLADAYPERLALFQEGKQLDPPIVNRVLGEAAGCQENAVIAALRKAKAKAAPPPRPSPPT